ncbi:MAG: hypothetical protein AUI14_14390 [Actinobacteria bacterium 13_2_20CM_2_71_6]|nr:MAG: hypothetical protein AUI14_14390 [Actinobacteria bacterium 13_2_20CM_2_71_6]
MCRALVAGTGLAGAVTAHAAPTAPVAWTPVFRDDFGGTAGSRLTAWTGGTRSAPSTTAAPARFGTGRGTRPQTVKWFLDGVNAAIGGEFPAALGGGPTGATASGRPMLVDYVAVFRG